MFGDAEGGNPPVAPQPEGRDELRNTLQTLADSQAVLMPLFDHQSRQNEIQAHRMETLEAELKRERESKGWRPLVDTKGLGKPNTFSGQITDWEPWCFKFVN